ncbi:MAG: ABC transporter permease [Bacteroidales bacterium]
MANKTLTQKISTGLSDGLYIWKNELKTIFSDSAVMIFFFLVPFAYPIIYAFIYNNEVVRQAPMVVVDDSRSEYSRDYIRKINGTPDVDIKAYCANMEEAKILVDKKKAYGILHIPSNFSKDLHAGRQTTVDLYSDMSCLLNYKAFLLSSTEASLDLGENIRFSLNPESSAKLQDISAEPVTYEAFTMFNTQNGFASFLVPAIVILILQQTLILGVCLLGGTYRERSRFGSLIPTEKYYHGIFRVVFGKALAYIFVYIIVCFWILILVPRLFNLPQLANFGTLTAFLLPFLFACIFLAITLSGFVKTRESPMLFFVFTSVILVFISGISWPWSNIPWFWKAIGYLFPSTPGIQGFVRINTMGANLIEVATEYKILWLQSGVYFFSACAVYRRQLQLTYQRICKERKGEKMKNTKESEV